MDATAYNRSSRIQARFTGFMLVVGCVLLAMVSLNSDGGQTLTTVKMLFTVGTFLTGVGLAAAVWSRQWLLYLVSIGLIAVGLAAIALLLIFPDPAADPFLMQAGLWQGGPVPLSAGWARLAMAGVTIFTGLAMPFACSRRNMVALASLTFVRISLWVGTFWQLAYVVLGGRFDRLFEHSAGVIQLVLVLVWAGSWAFLLRGERRWLRTLTEADRSVSLARLIIPMSLVPVVGAYVTVFGAGVGGFAQSVGPLLNVEISSVALLVVSSAALRELWRERRQRERLANALERSPVVVHSEEGLIEYWPQGCEALYEYSAQEAVGRRGLELLKTEYPIPIPEIESALRRTGEWAGDIRQVTKSGRRLWIATRIVVEAPGGEQELKLVETLTDITDLKLADAALRETTDSLSQAVATYELGIVDYDGATGRTSFSSEFERIIGVAPGALGSDQEEAWKLFLAEEEYGRMMDWVREDIARQATRRTLTMKARRSDGQVRDLQGMLRYRFSDDGKLLRMVGIYMDVTDQIRDRAEVAARGARLMALQSELTHTSRLSAMGEMAAALAHELNQPLTAVGNSVGAIELILKDDDKPVDDKVRQRVLRAARHAAAQAVRAGEIVRRLREFISRGEADTQAEDLSELIEDAVALALPNPAAAGVEIKKAISPYASRILADRIQIQQVLVNLVRNSVEAMRDQETPRKLTITATLVEGMAQVRVTDTGPGVPPASIQTLFSPFLSTKRDGMGVGLSICRRIIETHGGKMWFEPAATGGAGFNFTLPVIPNEVWDVGVQAGTYRR